MKEEKTHLLGSHLTDKRSAELAGDLKIAEQNAATGLRTAKQSKSHTDHLNHWPGHHSLRRSGGAWVLRLRLWRSVLRRGLGLAMWGQHEGLRSSAPQAGEQNILG